MNIFQTLRVAVRALLRNKTRSFLTTLGIIIGISAVIAMVAIGEGAKARVQKVFESMGSNLLVIISGSTGTGGARGGFGSMPTLTWDDLKAIQNEVSTAKMAAPLLTSGSQIQSEDQNWTTQVGGTTPDYFRIRSWSASQGVTISVSDVEAGNKVVVLGQTVVDKLFGPNVDVVGQVVRIKNIPFTVIGVLAKKGQSPMGQDYDNTVFIPVSAYTAKIQGGLRNYLAGTIFVGADSPESTARAEREIGNLLRERHHIQPGADDDFFIRNLTEMASATQEGTKTITTLLAAIAAVSLVVGGIGIMNIMLVSVTERTREIGLRMAIGARPRDILLQFLVEALTLSLIGGLVGVGLGLLASTMLAAQFGWVSLIRPDIVLIAVGFSALIGVGFGIYPARKASQLDPIDALRYE